MKNTNLPANRKTCPICKAQVKGRSDKIYCSLSCKNQYHIRLRRATAKVVKETDKILHRNRSILLELMGKNHSQKKVDRLLLEKKKFRFSYFTRTYLNKQGKTYYYVYDFAWMEFSDQQIMIRRYFPENVKY